MLEQHQVKGQYKEHAQRYTELKMIAQENQPVSSLKQTLKFEDLQKHQSQSE